MTMWAPWARVNLVAPTNQDSGERREPNTHQYGSAGKVSALRTEEYFRERVAAAIAPKACGFSNALEKGIPLSRATNFLRRGRRSQSEKWRMGEIRQ
jgi:hypothetical protein